MTSKFFIIDWIIFLGYFVMVAISSILLSKRTISNTKDYFLANKSMPMWAAAVSLLATTQSAATFLGGPESAYRNNLTYLFTYAGFIIGICIVAIFFIPKFYKYEVVTVYELLENRFGVIAKKGASISYLIGRTFASGARLYMAAIAVSMILFFDIQKGHILMATIFLALLGIAYAYQGGIRSVIWSDLIQFIVYVSASLFSIFFLLKSIPADIPEIIEVLRHSAADGGSKFKLMDFSFNGLKGDFTVWATLSGFVLLGMASHGMDQDMTQRLLTCKNKREGTKSAILGTLISIPTALIFMSIGLLLFIFYQKPEIMGNSSYVIDMQNKAPDSVQIFMYYLLNEMPSGLKGLCTIGVIAAALSTLNSGINSMSSVLINDFYKPYLKKLKIEKEEYHFVKAGRIGMLMTVFLLSTISYASYFMQQYSNMPLLNFALSMMVFAYTGLIGVFLTALFTKKGNEHSVISALIVGFLLSIFMQPYIWDFVFKKLGVISLVGEAPAFPWVLVIGSFISFLVCVSGKKKIQS